MLRLIWAPMTAGTGILHAYGQCAPLNQTGDSAYSLTKAVGGGVRAETACGLANVPPHDCEPQRVHPRQPPTSCASHFDSEYKLLNVNTLRPKWNSGRQQPIKVVSGYNMGRINNLRPRISPGMFIPSEYRELQGERDKGGGQSD